MKFEELNLHPNLLKAVAEEGYETPTPIQQQAIPHAMTGRDVVGLAQTGTGKTAAFALPILHRLGHGTHAARRPIRCLVLTPTRELATQIGDSFATYGRHTGIRYTVIFGGVGQEKQTNALRSGVDVLICTPGRLIDLMGQGHVHFEHVEIFVLDEADRMLDMGFIPDVKRVIAKLPKKRQSLFFSATMPPDVQNLADSMLTDPVQVAVAPVSSTAERIEQQLYFVEKNEKRPLLVHLLKDPTITRVLVFTRTKHGANKVAEHLVRAHLKADAIHGNKSQNARERALKHFKDGSVPILVATDIAARGIDIDEISHVINFDLPNIPESYVHRIGRTGRAGASGKSISFCDTEEREYLRDIERLIRRAIPVVKDHPFPSGSAPPEATDLEARRPGNPREARASQGPGQRRGHGSSHRRPNPSAGQARPSGGGGGGRSGGGGGGGRRPSGGGGRPSSGGGAPATGGSSTPSRGGGRGGGSSWGGPV